MKNFFVSAGLVALGATAMESAMADSVTSPKYWNVSATLRGFYDDNYNIANNGKGSAGVELVPSVSFHAPLQQTDIGLRYTYGLYYYADRDSLGVNPFDQTHQVDFWVNHAFNERWKGTVNDTFAMGQEPELLNPNPVTGTATPYRINGDNISNHGNLALNTEWTRLLGTTLTYDNGFYDYDNRGATVASLTSGSPATFAGALDRIEQSIALDVKWHIMPETTAFVGYSFSWANYTGNEPIAVLPGGFVYHSGDRDNNSHYVYVGASHEFTPNLDATVRAGTSYVDVYADPLFPSTSWNPYADISLSYTYIPGSYVQFGFTHDINATDQVQPDATGHITQYAESSVVYLDINHRFTPKLIATAIGRVQYSTYQGGAAGGQDTTDYGLGLNLTYQINQHFSVDAGYNFDDVVSGIGGYQYSRNRVYLGLSATY
jgi:hypothetical protein